MICQENYRSLALSSSPVVPYANVTLDNGQQVTVLLENLSLGHNKPQLCAVACAIELEYN